MKITKNRVIKFFLITLFAFIPLEIQSKKDNPIEENAFRRSILIDKLRTLVNKYAQKKDVIQHEFAGCSVLLITLDRAFKTKMQRIIKKLKRVNEKIKTELENLY